MNNPISMDALPQEELITPLVDHLSLIDSYEAYEEIRRQEAEEINKGLAVSLCALMGIHGEVVCDRQSLGTEKASEPIDGESELYRVTPEVTFISNDREIILRVVSYLGVSSRYRSTERAFAIQRKIVGPENNETYRNVVLAHNGQGGALDYEGKPVQAIDAEMYHSAIEAINAQLAVDKA